MELHGSKFVTIRNITVFKFPASWRLNSYRDKRCDEQADYARRIQTETDFLQHELIDVAAAYAQRKTTINLTPKKPRFVPLGWTIEEWRRIRGLDARPLAPLTAIQRILLFLYPFTFPLRKVRHAIMQIGQHTDS